MLNRRFALLLMIFTIPYLAWTQNSSRLIIDSGHKDSIESIVSHDCCKTLISADNNGLVKVWDLTTNKLVYQVNTGLKGTIQLKTHPEKKQFAILVSRPGYTKIAVWDWVKNKELFSRELNDKPIQFDYSAKGKYLFLTKISSPSMVMMDSQTGRDFSYLKRLYDLFSYAYIGGSESRVMTYSNSGTLKYWDIRTSTLQNEADTLTDLREITVLQTEGKRYFVARKGETLFLIDRLNGDVRDTLEQENMLSFSVDPDTGNIAIITKSNTGRLKTVMVKTPEAFFSPMEIGSFLGQTETLGLAESLQNSTEYFSLSGNLTDSRLTGRRLFLADTTGKIWEIDSETLRPAVFKKNLISDLKDLNFMDDSLFILSDKSLTRLQSSHFTGSDTSLRGFSDLNITRQDSPLPGDSEIEAVDSEKMIIWTRNSVEKGYVIYSPDNNAILNSNYSFESALNQLHVRNDQVLVLENSGEASLNNIHTGIRDFQFSALGMVSLNFLNDSTLLGGKSLMKSGRNPMFTVQTDTGEIIPLQDDRFLVYDILSLPDSNRTFTIGLANKGNNTVETSIQSHSINNPSSVSTVFLRTGEWIDAIFTADTSSYTPTLYGTITGRDIIRISGSRKKIWDYDKNIEKIFYHNSLLYILNTDGSLSLFNPRTERIILDFYLMEDNSWIAIPGQEAKPYISSSSASDFLNTFQSNTTRSVRNSCIIVRQN